MTQRMRFPVSTRKPKDVRTVQIENMAVWIARLRSAKTRAELQGWMDEAHNGSRTFLKTDGVDLDAEFAKRWNEVTG